MKAATASALLLEALNHRRSIDAAHDCSRRYGATDLVTLSARAVVRSAALARVLRHGSSSRRLLGFS